MACFLFTLWPMETHIRPGIVVAQSLRDRGHEVAFFTSPEACKQVKAEGFRCFEFQALDETHVNGIVAGLMEHWKRPWRTRKLWRQFLVDTLPAQMRDIENVLDQLAVDVIACDMALWAPMLVLSETRRIPVAVLSHVGYCILPGQRGVHPGVSKGLGGNYFSECYMRMLSTLMRLGARDIQLGANRLRVSHGLPALNQTVVEHTGTMPLYLVPSSPELDYQRDDLPSSVHYVGPYLRGGDAEKRSKESRQPCVLIIEGTNHNSDPWLLTIGAAAVAQEPVKVIVVVGNNRQNTERDSRGIVPETRFVDLGAREKLIASADVIVTGGSSEIVLPALHHGVPLVLVPSILEEAAMSRRVSDYGAGLLVREKWCTPARLQAAVTRVLREPSFRERANSIVETFRRCGGPEHAAFLLEGLATGGIGANCQTSGEARR